jgi:hypothetical protein
MRPTKAYVAMIMILIRLLCEPRACYGDQMEELLQAKVDDQVKQRILYSRQTEGTENRLVLLVVWKHHHIRQARSAPSSD